MTNRIDLDLDEIRRLYIDERLPEYVVARQMGVSRGTITDRLEAMGVERRSVAEANTIRYERLPGERRRAATNARNYFTGRKQKPETMAKKARTVYENQSQLSWYEQQVRDDLRELGIPAESLWPLGRWNVDVAVPTVKLAVEIHGGWHWSKKKRDQDARKAAELECQGWTLLVFARNQWSSDARAAFVDYIVEAVVDTHEMITDAQIAS